MSNLIAEKISKTAKFIIINKAERFPALNINLINAAVNIVPTNKRMEKFDFSNKYHERQFYLITKMKNVFDMNSAIKKKLHFGVVIGSIYDDFLSKFESRDCQEM